MMHFTIYANIKNIVIHPKLICYMSIIFHQKHNIMMYPYDLSPIHKIPVCVTIAQDSGFTLT